MNKIIVMGKIISNGVYIIINKIYNINNIYNKDEISFIKIRLKSHCFGHHTFEMFGNCALDE